MGSTVRDTVRYVQMILRFGVFREDGPEYGMGGAACTYWSIDRVEEVATIWFAQHIDTKKLRGVAADKADLWALLHEAIAKKATADSRKPWNHQTSDEGVGDTVALFPGSLNHS